MKRTIDILGVTVTAPLWMPLLGVIALLVRFKLGSPVFFYQARPGWHGKIFRLVKFRTMTSERDTSGQLLPDADRLQSFGRWLRSSSFDELPELINVLKGEMSLVGPRPLLVQYLSRYSVRHARRHEMRPGLTGLAQIMGRNTLSWEEKFEWDIRYIDSACFALDLKILCLTIKKVLFREGISSLGEATMPEFNPMHPAQNVNTDEKPFR
jgi:sugar transferase EpsL